MTTFVSITPRTSGYTIVRDDAVATVLGRGRGAEIWFGYDVYFRGITAARPRFGCVASMNLLASLVLERSLGGYICWLHRSHAARKQASVDFGCGQACYV